MFQNKKRDSEAILATTSSQAETIKIKIDDSPKTRDSLLSYSEKEHIISSSDHKIKRIYITSQKRNNNIGV